MSPPPTIPSSPTTLPPPPPSTSSTPIPSSPPSSILRPIYATLLLTCPVILLLPPRKLDLYTLTLCGAWAVSAEELAFGRARIRGAGEGRWFGVRTTTTPISTSTTTEEEKEQDENDKIQGGKNEPPDDGEKAGVSGLLRALWMGDEKPGWQRRRLEREREELERGRGYGEMIMEQVWEVFPGFGVGKGRKEGGDEGDGDNVEGRKDGE